MKSHMTKFIWIIALLPTLAIAGYSFETPSPHPDWEPGVEAIRRSDWTSAIEHLKAVIRNEPENADAHNALGLAYRQTKDIKSAMKHFREALRLTPEHRSAHENIGEAYVVTGDLRKAKEHLATLRRLCTGCDELKTLENAVANRR
ncbi:MAG TPA: tetratricopeptide repeat protein [Casimicrobiaceae bacterium]|nr:tetratricopeptide repeat protein [Casimicrobiaceae bacterium]